MADKNFFEALTQYRLKVEKDGENILNVPGLFALPGLLIAPKLSLTGLIAAPLLGFKIHVENEAGEVVDMEDAVRKAAETVKESVTTTTKTLREEIDKVWESVSADDPEENAAEDADETPEETETENPSNEEIEQDLKKHEENDIPTIEVKTDRSGQV